MVKFEEEILKLYKEKIWGIGKIKADKNNLDVLKLLFNYSSIYGENSDEILQKNEEKFSNAEHIIIFINDANMKEDEKLLLKANLFKSSLEIIQQNNLNYWIHIISLEDIKTISNDSRFELFDFFSTLEPLYDAGILEIFKLTFLHKTLVIQKFSKYVVAYVLAGSQVKGRSIESSDIDVYVVIDDTDVKKHTFEELKAKLLVAITTDALQAKILAKSNKELHTQVYTLTEFWKDMAENNPVIITFLRDGIALYDRGMFISWKQLLLKGIIKPSKEASDKYFTLAEETIREAENKMRDTINNLIIENIAVSVITAGQAILMRLGLLPADPKETPELLKKYLYEERKLLDEKDIELMKELWQKRKDLEHGKVKEYTYQDFLDSLEKAKKILKDLKSIINIIDKEKEEKDLEYYIEEYKKQKKTFEDLFKSIDILNNYEKKLFKDIERDIDNYYNKKFELLNFQEFLEKIKESIRILNKYIEEKIFEINMTYKYILISNNIVYDLYLSQEKLYIIDRQNNKIFIYDNNGNKIDEKDINNLNNILSEVSNKPKNDIDNKTFEALQKIFGSFSISKGI